MTARATTYNVAWRAEKQPSGSALAEGMVPEHWSTFVWGSGVGRFRTFGENSASLRRGFPGILSTSLVIHRAVVVCAWVQTITFELNDLRPRYLTC